MTMQVGTDWFDVLSIEPPDPPAPTFPPLPPSYEASLPLLWFFWIVSATLPPVCDAEFPELAVLPLSLVIEVGSHVLKLLELVLVVVWSQLPNWQVPPPPANAAGATTTMKIGRASCRERV